MNKRKTIGAIVESGILVAVAVALDYVFGLVSPFRYGGSISPAMLPIFVLAIRRGWKAGVAGGIAFGVLQSILNMYFLSFAQYALDYPVAFGVLGLAGLVRGARDRPWRFVAAILLGSFLRYLAHGFSGVVFWGEYAAGVNVWLYSFVLYNLPYMSVSAALCLFIGLILQKRGLLKPNRAE